jgi:hypothetical protein
VAPLGGAAAGGPASSPIKDPELMFQMLAAAHTTKRRPASNRAVLITATIVIPIVLVIGLIIGAHYLQHLAATTGDQAGTSAQGNLRSTVAAAEHYAAAHDQSLAGMIASPAFAISTPGLTFPQVSSTATEISLDLVSSDALVMTSLQSTPSTACVGIVDVLTVQQSPLFLAYPDTSEPGVYYFEAPVLAGECDAHTVTPPAGGSYVSRAGFPTTALP